MLFIFHAYAQFGSFAPFLLHAFMVLKSEMKAAHKGM